MAVLVLPSGRGHGWRPDTPSHRDYLFRDKFTARKAITGPVGLQEAFLPAIRDQGTLGSCTGHGVSGCLMYGLRQRGRKTVLSARYSYYQGRVIEACVPEDSGCEIRDVVKAAVKLGVATEATCPYHPLTHFARKPTKAADKTAQSHQIMVGYYRCLTVDDVLQALDNGMPVVGGFSCFSNLPQADANGHVPMPGPRDRLEGGHCVMFVRGDPSTREFKFANSWGEWGDHGYGYLPFEYLERGLADDFWSISHE